MNLADCGLRVALQVLDEQRSEPMGLDAPEARGRRKLKPPHESGINEVAGRLSSARLLDQPPIQQAGNPLAQRLRIRQLELPSEFPGGQSLVLNEGHWEQWNGKSV